MVGTAATAASFFTDIVREFTAGAIGLKNTVFDNFPSLARYAVIVKTLGGEAIFQRVVGHQGDLVTAVLKLAYFITGHKRRTRHRHFIAHYAIEFGGVAHRFMNRE